MKQQWRPEALELKKTTHLQVLPPVNLLPLLKVHLNPIFSHRIQPFRFLPGEFTGLIPMKLVLEGSVAHPAASLEIEFVITDLITDMLVRYEGQVSDLFREGHSVVVESFVKPITEQIKKEATEKSVSRKARSVDCYFSASEVLAKHDEKYMPAEVGANGNIFAILYSYTAIGVD